MEVEHLSNNQLSQADACLAWWATRYGPRVDTPSKPRDIGSLVHAMLELHLRQLALGGDVQDAAYGALVTAGSTAYYEDAKTLYHTWVKRSTLDPAKLAGVEEFVSRELEGIPRIIGYLDVIYVADDGALVVRDFKTGWSSDLTPEYEFQIQLACWMLSGLYPDRTVRGEIEFVRSGRIAPVAYDGYTGAIVEQRVRRTWERLRSTMFEIDTRALTDSPARFPETPGKHCTFCPRLTRCAAAAVARGQGEVVTDAESAREALVSIARLDAARKRLTSALKGWVDVEGAVEASGVSASFAVTEKTGCTDLAELVRREPAALGMVNFDGRKKGAKAITTANPDLFGVTKRGSRFAIGGRLDESDDEESEDEESDVA